MPAPCGTLGRALAISRSSRGIGGGAFLGAAVMKLDLDIAPPEDGKPRVHFAMGIGF